LWPEHSLKKGGKVQVYIERWEVETKSRGADLHLRELFDASPRQTGDFVPRYDYGQTALKAQDDFAPPGAIAGVSDA
jgi:hypothetical protein